MFMNRINLNLEAILPSGEKYYKDVTCDARGVWGPEPISRNFAAEAVSQCGKSAHRSNPESIPVIVNSLGVKNGKVTILNKWNHIIPLPLKPSSKEEYLNQIKDILKDIPDEFHNFITQEAWDRGHSAGYDEVIMIAEEMTEKLNPCIEKYRRNLIPY